MDDLKKNLEQDIETLKKNLALRQFILMMWNAVNQLQGQDATPYMVFRKMLADGTGSDVLDLCEWLGVDPHTPIKQWLELGWV